MADHMVIGSVNILVLMLKVIYKLGGHPALNCRPEGFFVLSVLCRKRVPHHNFFQKVTQLLTEVFEQLIQQRWLTLKSRYHLSIGLI